jgi:hypothetical protein
MDYFKKIYAVFILLFITNSLYSQEYNPNDDQRFASYADFVSKTWNITCKMLEGFKDMQTKATRVLTGERGRGTDMPYCPLIQSNNEDCILMYPFTAILFGSMDIFRDFDTANWYKIWPQGQIIGEIETVLGLERERPCCCQSGDPLIVFDDYVTTLTGKEAKDLFNVDKVYFYDLPVKHAYREKYTHYLGIVLSKKNRPDMFLKLCFTENGVKEKAQYVKMLKGKIWYEEK